ncbi:MAG TPA: putative zinc-binding metallopeptidase [Thermoanaerobaculia bacterium]|nr:putative zinc-binding metallopeptidase [Thermoanaerobaculia bacterium]
MAKAKRGKRRAQHRARRYRWSRWDDEEILDLRFSQLGLRVEGSFLNGCIADLDGDLERRELRFRPHFWLSREWFSPTGIPGVAIPFYLAHPRLMRLERNQMFEVEGGSREECVKILRHETGHAIQHAYQLHRLRSWQATFGPSSRRYPKFYRPNPASRRYVQHLRLYYGQSHPVEDFAETFAVWLQPRAAWRRRYAGWPALEKLEYVDRLMRDIGRRGAVIRTRATVEPLRHVRMTLREHYEQKREHYQRSYPDIYDRDLRQLFSDDPRHADNELASKFLRRNRREIRHLVARWTGEYEFTLEQVLDDMIGRCRELKLRTVGGERKLVVEFAVLLTVKTMTFHYARRTWFAL